MADYINVPTSTDQIQQNYEKYKDYFAEDSNDALGQDAFLTLMVEQMKNQDFMEPTDNSEYIAQMAQFSMVSEIQQMNYNTNATYATSLVGKTVVTGEVDESLKGIVTSTGVVSSVRLNGTSFEIVVNGKPYQLENIMEVLSSAQPIETAEEKDDEVENIEDANAINLGDTDNSVNTTEEEENEEVVTHSSVPENDIDLS